MTIGCTTCGAELPTSFRHCDACGSPLARPCPGCGGSNRAAARFCSACGDSLEAVPEAPTRTSVPLGPEELQSERKVVTVMFADVRGSTELIRELDPEDAAQLLEPAIRAMVDSVRRFGGTVARVQGDGVMALFGAPIAREDHAERACLAALQILRTAMPEPSARLTVRIGINSGAVLVQRNLNDVALDYDAIGAPSHIAARLEQQADADTAVISATTLRLAGGAIRTRPLGKLELRGLAEPIEAYALVAAAGTRDRWDRRAQIRPLSPFVGREAELAALARARSRTLAGTGQTVLVVGDPGTGKSRLLHEFLGSIGDDMTVLRSGATPFDADRPFASVADIAQACVAALERRDDAGLGQFIRADAQTGPALRFLLGRPIDDAQWDALDTITRRERIVHAVRRLIVAVADERALLLVFEDLHWADSESRAIAERVLASMHASSVMVLATTRPDYLPRTLRENTTALRLQALDSREAETMLVNTIGPSESLAELRRLLIARTEGTPLFIEETLQMLFDSGTL
ncbi:MAG: AAA family ATPase, partial [Acidisphaera sp.]|nr:AAA family ATPase [Acidisphaera sp.]